MIKVLIVDGNVRLGHVMGQLLDDDERFRLVAVVSTGERALQAAQQHAPDVVLVSQQLADAGGAAVCAGLRSAVPAAALLLWSHGAPRAGAERTEVDAVIERGMTYRELATAVRAAHAARRDRRVVDLTGQPDAART